MHIEDLLISEDTDALTSNMYWINLGQYESVDSAVSAWTILGRSARLLQVNTYKDWKSNNIIERWYLR